MKRIFQTIGMITLVCVSFIFTEKTANVVKEMDQLMIEIKEKSIEYKQEPINATVNDKTIIPGINGKVVDEKKSYNEMKRIGSFNENALIYKQIKPNISIDKNYSKYLISGNNIKKEVTLIFIIKDNDNIDGILEILKEQNIKVNFFIDSIWLENNNDKIIELIEDGHIIGNLSYNQDYSHSDFIWIDTIIKKVGKQKQGFCYTEKETDNILKTCETNKNYTVIPSLVTNTDTISNMVKSNLKNGSIISIPTNDVTKKDLPLILKYIKAKGYKIVNLEKIVDEQNL